MNTKTYAALIGLLLCCKLSQGQPFVAIEYNSTTQQDFNTSICESGGYFFTCGTTDDIISGTLDVSVTCRTSAGIVVWNKNFDFGGNNDFGGKIHPTPYGVVLTGTTGGLYDDYKQLFVLHLDLSGNVINEGLFSIPKTGKTQANLYGFDVVYEPIPIPGSIDPNFMVVGMGVYPNGHNDEMTERFGFIMKTSYDLSTVVWSKYYTTDPAHVGSWFDCMNNIERIMTYTGPKYHLTGSLSDYNSTWTQDQAVLNMLVDENGIVSWDHPFRQQSSYWWGGRHYDRGTNVLVNSSTNDLYLLYHSSWGHGQSIVRMNLLSGIIMKNMWFLPNQENECTESNMVWTTAAMNDITLAGYKPTGGYRTFLLTGPVNDFDITAIWQKEYSNSVNMTNLQSINYDYNLKPMNSPGHQQPFFAPHWLIRNNTVGTNFMMATLTDAFPGHGYFDNVIMQVNGVGYPPGTCYSANYMWQGDDVSVHQVTPGFLSNISVDVTDVPPNAPDIIRMITSACDGGGSGIPTPGDCVDTAALIVNSAYSISLTCYFNVYVTYTVIPSVTFVGVIWRYPIAFATYTTTFTSTPYTTLPVPSGVTGDIGATIVTVDENGDTCYTPEYTHTVGCNGGYPSYKQGTTSISSVDVPQISLYPNPTTGIVRIDCPKEMIGAGYIINDITGKTITKGTIQYSGQDISLESLPSGVYTFKLLRQGYPSQNYKLIKN